MKDSRAQEQGLTGLEPHMVEQQGDDDPRIARMELGEADRPGPLGPTERRTALGACRHHGRGQRAAGLGVEGQQPGEGAA